MSAQITDRHLQRPAFIYVRQSTLGQVRHHRESTERQYALREKALGLGWSIDAVRVLDRDLGQSGAQSRSREDFKTLVAEVSMDRVGAVFALEVSRLARSNLDWQRLLELCALTDTLVIDEDGCYNPADFNDGLLLGLKGTMAQAELHLLRGRLLGGKLNKAKKGELRFPLPVGLCYDDSGRIVLDPDEEVRGAVALVFRLFHETGTAYAVVQRFAKQRLRFPKRAYGGVWDGQLVWGRLTHERVLGLVKNPAYAGAYVYGRYQYRRTLTPQGEVHTKTQAVPMDEWRVKLQGHHEGYIEWDEYLANQQRLDCNCTHREATVLSGPAREGLALLQGLLVCGQCGRRLSVRYQGNGGIYPTYQCNWRRREGLATRSCLSVRCDLLDVAIAEQVLEALQPAEYEAQLAERRYQEVDPANRLVAATLEQRWNETLQRFAALKEQFAQRQREQARVLTAEQRTEVLALAQDFPRLWHAPTTEAKDRKRMLRLLIKDITAEKPAPKRVLLHIRWQGGACTDASVDLPLNVMDRVRYPKERVKQIRDLATTLNDAQIADTLNRQGVSSPKGKAFTASIIKWVRYKHSIERPQLKHPDELTVDQMMNKFNVSRHVVYYWIERGIIDARQIKRGTPYWIRLDAAKEQALIEWVNNSSRIPATQDTEKAL